MKKLIIALLLICSIANAGTSGHWQGFTSYLAPLGDNNYELTLYRHGQPVTEKDYSTAQLKAINVCTNGRITSWEQASTLDLESYTEISKSLENTPDRSAITYDFHCNF